MPALTFIGLKNSQVHIFVSDSCADQPFLINKFSRWSMFSIHKRIFLLFQTSSSLYLKLLIFSLKFSFTSNDSFLYLTGIKKYHTVKSVKGNWLFSIKEVLFVVWWPMLKHLKIGVPRTTLSNNFQKNQANRSFPSN